MKQKVLCVLLHISELAICTTDDSRMIMLICQIYLCVHVSYLLSIGSPNPTTHKGPDNRDEDATFDVSQLQKPSIVQSKAQWGSPHGTLDPNPMRIGDLGSTTTLSPHGLDLDPSCVLCCVTAHIIECVSSSPAVQCT